LPSLPLVVNTSILHSIALAGIDTPGSDGEPKAWETVFRVFLKSIGKSGNLLSTHGDPPVQGAKGASESAMMGTTESNEGRSTAPEQREVQDEVPTISVTSGAINLTLKSTGVNEEQLHLRK
jgi:hypothetical protein